MSARYKSPARRDNKHDSHAVIITALVSIHVHAKCKIAAAMHWYVNSGAMTMAVTNAVDVVSSAINAILLTNDTHVCDYVFSCEGAALEVLMYVCLSLCPQFEILRF